MGGEILTVNREKLVNANQNCSSCLLDDPEEWDTLLALDRALVDVSSSLSIEANSAPLLSEAGKETGWVARLFGDEGRLPLSDIGDEKG